MKFAIPALILSLVFAKTIFAGQSASEVTLPAGGKVQLGNTIVSCARDESVGSKYVCGKCFEGHYSEAESGRGNWFFNYYKIELRTGKEEVIRQYDCHEVFGFQSCKKLPGGRWDHIPRTGFRSQSHCEMGRRQASVCL